MTTTAVLKRVRAAAAGKGPARPAPGRLRVDGKFFTRGGDRFRVRGVTYGPFAPGADGHPFPDPARCKADFALMRAAGVNTVRTYHPPPGRVLDLAGEAGLGVLVDVPWPKHLCFLDSAAARAAGREAVRAAAKLGAAHPAVLAYSVGNEIPANVVRWHGAARVERFLGELAAVSREADPDGLVTYANFPPTEYLDLPFLDFVTFNVYLHDPEAFRRYLIRLHHLAGDRPVLLGELGMDTLRNGAARQAEHLRGHLREATLLGAAGAVVFSWTDDWHTGGHRVEDWAFGLTTAARDPKPAYHAVREVFTQSPAALLAEAPRASVVVCSYNGGPTLEQCLRSLADLAYPDYEVILVDDGSTDATRDILTRLRGLFAPEDEAEYRIPQLNLRVIHQPNRGLSEARNVGLRAATGSVVAYTDSDCFADPDWLTHLVYQLARTGAAAVGGPNLTPDDGWLAGCVAAAPGQPTHVLETDQVAEHVPGCNMAFRRDALLAINGFDPVYRKAGDDVDVCWRLQAAGLWITFAPGAFVWHHRRQTPRAFFRQQAGYGEAEALLRFKHPDKFNSLGDGKWRGVLYGASLQGVRLGGPMIYRGTFGTGLFQCVYRRGPAHWAMLPSTLEWHLAAALAGAAGAAWGGGWVVAAAMLLLSLAVAGAQAAQAVLPPGRRGPLSRLVVAGLCYAQPLVRSWRRYRTRLFSYCPPSRPDDLPPEEARRLPATGRAEAGYWSEVGHERTDLLTLVLAHLTEHRWGAVVDSGWSDWDVRVDCPPWVLLEVRTAQEDHGGGRRLVRVRYRTRAGGLTKLVGVLGLACAGLAAAAGCWPALAGTVAALAVVAVGWWRGLRRASGVVDAVDALARRSLGMLPLGEPPAADGADPTAEHAAVGTAEATALGPAGD